MKINKVLFLIVISTYFGVNISFSQSYSDRNDLFCFRNYTEINRRELLKEIADSVSIYVTEHPVFYAERRIKEDIGRIDTIYNILDSTQTLIFFDSKFNLIKKLRSSKKKINNFIQTMVYDKYENLIFDEIVDCNVSAFRYRYLFDNRNIPVVKCTYSSGGKQRIDLLKYIDENGVKHYVEKYLYKGCNCDW